MYIPEILNKSEIEEYKNQMVKFATSMQKSDFSGANQCIKQIEKLGNPSFLIMHDPNEPPQLLYPTLPTDIGKLILIQKIVVNELFGI